MTGKEHWTFKEMKKHHMEEAHLKTCKMNSTKLFSHCQRHQKYVLTVVFYTARAVVVDEALQWENERSAVILSDHPSSLSAVSQWEMTPQQTNWSEKRPPAGLWVMSIWTAARLHHSEANRMKIQTVGWQNSSSCRERHSQCARHVWLNHT